jgi:hypothetical protein
VLSKTKYKMKAIIVIAILLLNMLANCLHAQDFTYFNKTYGGNDTINILAQAVQPVEDGYLVFGNYANNTIDYGMFIMKTDTIGNFTWLKNLDTTPTFQQLGISRGTQVIKEHDNITLLYGKQKNIHLSKLNFSGDTIWHKIHDTPTWLVGEMVLKCDDNGYLIAGMEQNVSADTTKGYVLKVDSLGNFEWDKRYIMGNDARFFSVQPTPWDGGYILGGMGYSTTTGYDMFVVKIYANGDTMWTKRYGSAENDCGALVVPLTTYQEYLNGLPIEYLMTGCWESNTPDLLYGFVDYLYNAKLDENGNIIWVHNYINAAPWLMLQTLPIIKADKSFIGTGFYFTDDYVASVKLISFAPNGEIAWQKNYTLDPEKQCYIKDLQPTPDGGYVLAGFQYSVPQTAWVLKIDSLGNTCSVVNCDSTATVIDNINTPSLSGQVFALSPNPATTQATLYIAQPAAGRQLRIYNMSGQQVKNLSLPDYIAQYHFSVADLPAGVYVCKVGDALGQKLVVGK